MVPLRYQKIDLVAFKCDYSGLYIYMLIRFTTNRMLGLVFVRKINLPTRLQ
jgi:hypothetical protein